MCFCTEILLISIERFVLCRFQSAPVHFQGPLLAFLSLTQIQYGRRDDVTDYFL